MPQSLAPSRLPSRLPLVCLHRGIEPERAANDNGCMPESDLLLHAALRHFAEHGMGAARAARAQAEAAFFAADRAGYDWWLAICRTLDRRLAARIDHELGGEQGSAR